MWNLRVRVVYKEDVKNESRDIPVQMIPPRPLAAPQQIEPASVLIINWWGYLGI